MGKICKNMPKFMKSILRNSMTKDFCNIFRKLNASTEHDLEFLMLLKGNPFQNGTFFSQECTKSYRRITFFLPKSLRFAFSMPFNLTKMV